MLLTESTTKYLDRDELRYASLQHLTAFGGKFMSVGYLADAFDLINVRDLDLIAQAHRRCSRLILGVFTDEYAEQTSGRRPVIPLAERMAILEHVRGVAGVVPHEGEVDALDRTSGQMSPPVCEVFAAVDSPASFGQEVTWLTPVRYSQSAYLRTALAPRPLEVVA